MDEPSKLTLMNVVQELVAPPYLTDIVDLLDLESVKQRAEAALEQVITEAELDGATKEPGPRVSLVMQEDRRLGVCPP